MSDFNVRFVYEHPTFRPTIYSMIEDRVDSSVRSRLDDAFRYRLPTTIDNHLERKLPGHIETYLVNHRATQDILHRVEQKVEEKSRSVMRRVTMDDPAQNVVFGAFMDNQKDKCDRKLRQIETDSETRITALEDRQMWNTYGWILAVGVGLYGISIGGKGE